jgi:ribosomal protein S27AE
MTAEPREMVCPACGASWFSAAAEDLVAKGHRCQRCGNPLALAKEHEEDDETDG